MFLDYWFPVLLCRIQTLSNTRTTQYEAKIIRTEVHTWVRVRRPARDIIIPSNGFFGAEYFLGGRFFFGSPRFLISYYNIRDGQFFARFSSLTSRKEKISLAHYIRDWSTFNRFRESKSVFSSRWFARAVNTTRPLAVISNAVITVAGAFQHATTNRTVV